MTLSKAAAVGSVAVAVLVGMVILLKTDHWWLTAVAFIVLAIALTIVTLTIIGLASTTEYPDPTLLALLSEAGVRDPEVRFSEIVQEFTPVDDDDEHRSTAVEDDPARAAAEQQSAGTPAGGASQAVGPGSSS